MPRSPSASREVPASPGRRVETKSPEPPSAAEAGSAVRSPTQPSGRHSQPPPSEGAVGTIVPEPRTSAPPVSGSAERTRSGPLPPAAGDGVVRPVVSDPRPPAAPTPPVEDVAGPALAEPPLSSVPTPPVDGAAGPALTDGLQFGVRPLALPGLPPSHLRHVLTNGRYLVTKTAAAALLVWGLEDGATLTALPMQNILLPHPRVECMALQDNCGHLLAACARNILLWDLREPCRAPVTLGEDFSGVACCHLSAGGEAELAGGAAVLSLGVSQSVWLLDTVRVQHLLTLRGHECAVTCVRLEGTLCVAGSESGQVKIWDTAGPCLLYSSHVLAPRLVGDVTIDRVTAVAAAGCGSQVTVAAAAAAGRWTQVATAELCRPAPEGRSTSPLPECAVLSLLLLRRPSSALFGPHSLLLVVTTGGLTVLNTHTWLPVYTAPGIGPEPWGGSSLSLTPGGAVVVCGRTALRGHVTAFCLDVLLDSASDRLSQLSIVCRSPLPAGSVLRARLPRTAPCRPAAGRKVRSSGYGSAPHRTMFQPRTNTARPRPAKPGASRLSLSNLPSAEERPAASPDRPPGPSTASYDCHVTSPTASRPLRILRQGDTLLRIALSGNGRHLACSSRQGHSLEVARLHELDVSQDKFLMGTQGPISAVSWSLSGSRLAAASAAGLQLWTFPGGEPCGRRPAAKAPFTAVQFFFTDEFLLSAGGDTVGLCRLPAEHAEHAAPLSSLRPVLQCHLPCREVLHVAGACQFRSTLAVVCCSDNAVRLLDVQAGRVVSTLCRAHRHPPHLARLCEGSPHLPTALPLYDLVGSVAVSDGVRLWDVRSGRLAARLAAPDLRALPAGFQVSPCGRLLALGSDTAQVALWDVRSARGPLARLRAAAAGVSDVAFHPRRPGLVAALLDGRVQSWSLDGGRDD